MGKRWMSSASTSVFYPLQHPQIRFLPNSLTVVPNSSNYHTALTNGNTNQSQFTAYDATQKLVYLCTLTFVYCVGLGFGLANHNTYPNPRIDWH